MKISIYNIATIVLWILIAIINCVYFDLRSLTIWGAVLVIIIKEIQIIYYENERIK